MLHAEAVIYRQITSYLRVRYPEAAELLHWDMGAGGRTLSSFAAKREQLLNRPGYPDMFLAWPSGGYHGLFLEVKQDGTRIWLRNGQLSANDRVRRQYETLQKLKALGYAAEFGVGYEECQRIIDSYLKT